MLRELLAGWLAGWLADWLAGWYAPLLKIAEIIVLLTISIEHLNQFTLTTTRQRSTLIAIPTSTTNTTPTSVNFHVLPPAVPLGLEVLLFFLLFFFLFFFRDGCWGGGTDLDEGRLKFDLVELLELVIFVL